MPAQLPAPRYVGKTGLGPRGDVISQLDDHVGAVIAKLEQLKLPAGPDNKARGTSALFDGAGKLTRLGECYGDA